MAKEQAPDELWFGEFKVRPVEEQDLPAMLKRRNQPEMKAAMFTDHDIIWSEHTAWFEQINRLETKLHFIAQYHDIAVGYFGYNKVDFASMVCYAGIYGLNFERIKVPMRGICLGEICLEYVFGVLGMNKVCAQVLAKANGSVAWINSNYYGFQEEGVLKEHVYKNGVYDDIILQAIFRRDWQERRQQYIINN